MAAIKMPERPLPTEHLQKMIIGNRNFSIDRHFARRKSIFNPIIPPIFKTTPVEVPVVSQKLILQSKETFRYECRFDGDNLFQAVHDLKERQKYINSSECVKSFLVNVALFLDNG